MISLTFVLTQFLPPIVPITLSFQGCLWLTAKEAALRTFPFLMYLGLLVNSSAGGLERPATLGKSGKGVEPLPQEPGYLLPPGFPSNSLSTETLSCLAALVEGVCGCGKLLSSSAGVLLCHLRLCKPEGQEFTKLSLFSSEILILGRWCRMPGCLSGILCWRKCGQGRARGAR